MKSWTECVLTPDSTIKEIIENLNQTSARIVLIADSQMLFKGIVVDGDIRRAMLRGATLKDNATKIINRNAKTILPEVSRFNALKLMESWTVSHLPVVDSAGKLCGLQLAADSLFGGNRTNIFLIMAGGLGTRMGAETTKTPKPMLEVAGKPMLEHLIMQAKKSGFVNFAISVHHHGKVIEDYFGDGSLLGIRIAYLREQYPLGTAGSLTLLNPAPTEPVVVSNADLVSTVDFGAVLDFHVNQCSDITIAVQDHELQNPFGVVKVSHDKVIEIVEKPIISSKICAGIYVLDPSVIASIPRDESCDMPFVLQNALSRQLTITPFQLHEDWMDVGRQSDLIAAKNRISGI
jgi:dTDP-glucose pyrophosphorylase